MAVRMRNSWRSCWALAALALTALAGCGGSEGSTRVVSLTGAGATFPYPIYSKWFDAFHQATGDQINYQSIGSGAGIKQYVSGTVDFGATDGPMSAAEIAKVKGRVLHIPTVMGAVALTWNLPGVDSLRLDGDAIAGIFGGRITRWNDPHLEALNPDANLPDRDLLVVHRSDGSGTTYIFTDYLAKVSVQWRDSVGIGKSVAWPVGLGGKGNEGVTQQIKQVPGTIGYVELIYAAENGLPTARVQNRAGSFVAPTLASVTAAGAGVELPDDTDFRVSITDAAGVDSYPIASYTWLLIHPDNASVENGATIKRFLEWTLTPEARKMASELRYSPIPDNVADLVRQRLNTLTADGNPLP